jgi:hypothetical protein
MKHKYKGLHENPLILSEEEKSMGIKIQRNEENLMKCMAH